MSLTIENQSFPCLRYFKKLISDKYIKIEIYEFFEKRSFRNRYVIAGANGLLNLTIPIKGGREQKVIITDVEIDDTEDWRMRHWRGITSGYSKSPFFDYYSEGVRSLLISSEKNLFYFNISILKQLCKWLEINVTFDFTKKFEAVVEGSDLRNCILPNNFQNNCGNWQPKYPQVFEDRLGFQPNLSILDLLFCEGPNATYLLKNSVNRQTEP